MANFNLNLFSAEYCNEARKILDQLNHMAIESLIQRILECRDAKGRIFFIGVGGGAGNAGHAVNDFRKLAGIECYSPSDNISELTARTNDEGWETTYSSWLKVSRLTPKDILFIFSVGGGDIERNVSTNIVDAIRYGNQVGAKVLGVVGRDGGYTAKVADACVVIPTVNPKTITPHTESFQALIWHLIVSDPRILINKNKW